MWIKDLDVVYLWDQEYWQKQPEFTFYYNVLNMFSYYYLNFVKSYQTEAASSDSPKAPLVSNFPHKP